MNGHHSIGSAPVIFPATYLTARDRFRDASDRLGWRARAYAIDATGPQHEDLTIDVAISPPADADRVLVISSGLHGVEGPFGSAVQLALMERWQRDGCPTGIRCVLVHALNPFGYAWSRRCDGENVDPNRNFLLEAERYEGSPVGYAEIDPWLNPARPPGWWDGFYARAVLAAGRHGRRALQQALVGGQHDFPRGLFFGGSKPSRTHAILRQHLGSWVGQAEHVVHLDLHTGLGASGIGKLLVDYPLDAGQHAQLNRWFGAEVIEEVSEHGDGYRARGSFGPWCVAQQCAPDYLFAFAEFGTYGPLAVLAGLRRENQAHHWGRPDQPGTIQAKVRLRELFCPASPTWRSRGLANGLVLVDRAIAGLGRILRTA